MRIFIGFDPRETVAASVLAHSIQRRATRPVSISYVALPQLPEYSRPKDPQASTEFSFSRFLVPYLCKYGPEPVLFLDSDMLCLANVCDLFDLYDDRYAVQVVKHRYRPVYGRKFLDAPQAVYSKKNWSSVMLLQPTRCRRLTVDYVNTATGMQLHQFQWLDSDAEIGELPKGWNYLVGEENQCPIDEVKIAHFTRGGPYFKEFDGCEFSRVWHLEVDDMTRCDQRVA